MAENPAASILLQPRDPLLFRDARPFSADPGARAVSMPWPLPQTVAGALRTHIGGMQALRWTQAEAQNLLGVRMRGPLLLGRPPGHNAWTVYVAAPQDAVAYVARDGTPALLCLRPGDPNSAEAGCNLPEGGLVPLRVEDDVKATGGQPFWSLADAVRWLSATQSTGVPVDALGGLPTETRTHVGIDSATGTALEGRLFSTRSLVFAEQGRAATLTRPATPATAILTRVENPPAGWPGAMRVCTLGGERRPAALEPLAGDTDPWPAPVALPTGGRRLRLQLVTPAIFTDGWRPGWMGSSGADVPPAVAGLRLRLRAAAVGRPLPVSGWDMQQPPRQPGRPAGGPKATRYAAPAGSVYFFELDSGTLTADQVRSLWLQSISDGRQERNDGYGLVLPGIW